MATKKTVARSKAPKNAAAKTKTAAAEALAQLKAVKAAARGIPLPKPSQGEHPSSVAARVVGGAREKVSELQVPMSLGEICSIIGVDVAPESFAFDALEAIGDQIDTLATLVETDASHDAWRLFKNLSERAQLAGRVTAWLESETTGGAA